MITPAIPNSPDETTSHVPQPLFEIVFARQIEPLEKLARICRNGLLYVDIDDRKVEAHDAEIRVEQRNAIGFGQPAQPMEFAPKPALCPLGLEGTPQFLLDPGSPALAGRRRRQKREQGDRLLAT